MYIVPPFSTVSYAGADEADGAPAMASEEKAKAAEPIQKRIRFLATINPLFTNLICASAHQPGRRLSFFLPSDGFDFNQGLGGCKIRNDH